MSSSGRLVVFLLLFLLLMLWNFPSLGPVDESSIKTTAIPTVFDKYDTALDPSHWTYSQKLLPPNIWEFSTERPSTKPPTPWNPPVVFKGTTTNSSKESFASVFKKQSIIEHLEADTPEFTDEDDTTAMDTAADQATEAPEENPEDVYLTTNPNMFQLGTAAPMPKKNQPGVDLAVNDSKDMWVFI